MTLKLEKYGQIISDKALGEIILSDINNGLAKYNNVTVDFQNVKSMATFNAKQIFGQLYGIYGADVFFKRITIKNASNSVLAIIKQGINDFLKQGKVQLTVS